MPPEAHLSSHCRMSTQSWLSGKLRLLCIDLLCIFSHLLNLFCFLGPYQFHPSCAHACMGYSHDVSSFLEEISSPFHFILFFSISFHCSLKKGFLSLLAILQSSAFSWVYLYLSPLSFTSLQSSALCKASSGNHFAFLNFFFFGMILSQPPVQSYEPLSIIL